jgi:cyclopropane-fatty-acyl-phospholipid synthase
MTGLATALKLVEKGYVPDAWTRRGIRRLLKQRLRQESSPTQDAERSRFESFVAELRHSPVAICTEDANNQHYEVPAAFFQRVLGPHLKYSCCLWDEGVSDLASAEAAMLSLTCRRAQLEDGQRILELGCGWGSLTLWMARRYPAATIVAMSNSASQREFILERASREGLRNVSVVTADINRFEPEGEPFDRVVSVEMFEHVRNHQMLLGRIQSWLTPAGKLFVHIFCHRRYAYAFETEGADNWMGRHFFTGGIMPSEDLLLQYQEDLALERRWRVEGTHYARTARAWLENLDRRRAELRPVLEETYGIHEAERWRVRWRLFFMACEELFGYGGGEEWVISHYRFRKL